MGIFFALIISLTLNNFFISPLFIITLLFQNGLSIYNLGLFGIYSLTMLSYGIINKDDFYKIFSYVYINEVLLYIFDSTNIHYTIFSIVISTVN